MKKAILEFMQKTMQTLFMYISIFWSLNSFAQMDSLPKSTVQFCSKNEFGVLIGLGSIENDDNIPISPGEFVLELSTANGIQYNRLFVGLGIGVRKWDDDFLLPVFASASYNLWKNKNSLFLHVDLGHQFGNRQANFFGDKETGSFFAAYGLGYDLSVAKHTKLYLKASVCHQKMKAAAKAGLGPGNYLEPYDPGYLFLRISLGLKLTN